MLRKPIQGIAGAKEQPTGKQKPRVSALPEEEAEELTRHYLVKRNESIEIANRMKQIALEQKKGTLIARRTVETQGAYLYTGLRQQLLSLSHGIPRRMQSLSDPQRHELRLVIHEEVCSLLRELPQWPARITDPNWLSKIDRDLIAGNGGGKGAESRPKAGKRR